MSAIYPFSAVVGQERLKLALLLTAIDPGIGGVLVRGPRGVAKTTLARALSELVPGRFVELPVGATEERVIGTLDLAGALREGKVEFAPGLLARAHEGVLYVDEVNLLPDAVVDVLLDAASSGVNVVERDGISHRHAARFVLVGTMNPDEGELRPQLTDRFGLSVSAAAEIVPVERAEIVTRRLLFEQDAHAFSESYAKAQRELTERCADARKRVHDVPLAGAALALVTERCFAARVEGVRADLAMLRAARAHAAWHGRVEITEEDVDAVAELALAHRRREGGPGDAGGPGSGSGADPTDRSSAPGGAGPSRVRTDTAGVNGARSEATARPEGDRGRMPPVSVVSLPPRALPPWLQGPRARGSIYQPHSEPRVRGAGGRRSVPGSSIDWFATLARARPAPPFELRYRRQRQPQALLILVLDCSASMLRAGALARAKGVARVLARAAAARHEAVALIWFGGTRVHVRRATRGQAVLERVFAELGAGGGTPLRSALFQALAVGRQPAHRAIARRIVLLTDGRTRAAIAALPQLGLELDPVVVDCERTRVRLHRARAIASRLGARYVHVDEASATVGGASGDPLQAGA